MSAAVTTESVIESTAHSNISAVAFTADGHIFCADEGGEIRRWRIEDAHYIEPMMKANGFVESAVVSKDGRWLVTGDDGRKGIVWNAQTHEKVLEVTEHQHFVYTVDIPSDSTRFASGSCDKTVRIFSITTGVQLIPPLQHDRAVVGLKFSPSGNRLATATYDVCVRVYDSYTGDKLFNVPIRVKHAPTTPLAWSPGGQELFVVSPGKITCLNTSDNCCAEWLVHNNGTRSSIVTNGEFIACSGGPSVSLWDAISHHQIGPLVQHAPSILCISLSPDEKFLACGHGTKISVHRLMEILPDLYVRHPTPLSSDLVSRRPLGKKCVTTIEPVDDGAFSPLKHDGAITQCSATLPLNPNGSYVNLLIERSKARAMSGLWEDALADANKVIQTDTSCYYAYERKYVALHGMGRYDEAIQAFDSMLSVIERSRNPEVHQLRTKYVSSAHKRKAIDDTIRKIFKHHGPLVLIDVTTGRLCDRKTLPELFKSELKFKELVSSLIGEMDNERIRKTVKEYFGYVMLSHVWGNGKEEEKEDEPSFKSIKSLGSIYRLSNTPLNNKLRNFCARVTDLGYRWAWSDTCCIDKSDDAILSRSLRSMYKWYEASDATLVFLADVSSSLGDLLHSLWMTRAWTLQEAFAPRRILFYDQNWMLYRGIVTDNHKKPGVVLQELANAAGVSCQILASFHPDSLDVREKLRLASTRNATIEEDAAYSLIGIFKSDIIPRYGEGEDALGHLLEGIVAHSGDATVLAWTGSPSSYNSCLPSTLAVYSRTPYTPPTLKAGDMESRTNRLLTGLSKAKAMSIYRQIVHITPVRFANRRLQLPCIVFRVRWLDLIDRNNHEYPYRAKVSGLGTVEFTTAHRLPLAEPRRLVFVHPWISDIRGLHDGVGVEVSDSDTDMGSEREAGGDPGIDKSETGIPSLDILPSPPMDDHALAFQMIAHLGQPFNALLLLRQPGGEYRRVAAENEIIAKVSDNHIKSKDIRVQVLDIL